MRQRVLGPDDSRAPIRRSRHGLTADEIDGLIALQGGVCAICHDPGPLQIDHDHQHCPGRVGCRHCVRGALCHRCNQVLYYLDDDPKLAQGLAAYLERTAAR